MTGYVPGGRLADISRLLSDRDRLIIADIAKVRLLHTRQIERLQFWQGTKLSNSRQARRVLKRLYDQKILKRLQRRIGGVYAGSAGFIYALDSLGQRLMQVGGPAGGQRRRRPWEPSPAFQDHILQVAELYVRLRELERNHPDVELVDYVAEPRCWRRFDNVEGTPQTLKPDAYARVAIGEFEQVSFIEVDRATEHVPTLRRKLAAYVAAFEAGVEQHGGEAFPNVVWVVPDQPRVTVLERAIGRLPPDHAALFAVSIDGSELETITNTNLTIHPEGGTQNL